MNYLDTVILGVVEGVTEFLPVSSTGHLILTSSLLHLPDSEFLKSFEIAIQLGAICAVLALFWRKFLNIEILKRVLVGFVPTAIIGLVLYPVVKGWLSSELVVLTSLALGGLALIIFEYFHSESESAVASTENISYKQALGIGFFQTIAIIPGVSRSAATIVGGLVLGLTRTAIVEFSFLLAVPTIGAATALDLLKNYESFTGPNIGLTAVGFVTAFGVALAVIKFFLSYVRNRTFTPFGIYRILIALLFFFLIL
jgi:undecaprenyl-diphosphatase